jgi:hypothetical protein
MKKIFDELKAKREAMRASGQAPAPEGAGPRPDGPMTEDQRKEFAAARVRDGFGQVWILEDTGKIRPVPVRTGITDNTYAALLAGDLKEGIKVILGTGAGSAAATTQQGPPMGMMFGGPPRR